MPEQLNFFNKGINKDTNLNNIPAGAYLDALNMRIIPKDDYGQGVIQNEKGTIESIDFTSNNQRSYKMEITTEGDWFGNFRIAGTHTAGVSNNDLRYVLKQTTLTTWNANYTYVGSFFSPNYSYLLYEEFQIYQKRDKITIHTDNLLFDITKFGGDGVLSTPTLVTNIDTDQDQIIIGSCNLRNDTILFTTKSTNISSTPSGTEGNIWKATFLSAGTLSSLELIYSGTLNFSLANPIEAQGHFINDKIGKVYFADGYNNLRHINIYDPTIAAQAEDKLDMISAVDFVQPKILDVIGGGHYTSGVVQYAYQLFDLNGAETIISPSSVMAPLTQADYSSSDSRNFGGSPVDESTGKSVIVNIPLVDEKYNYLRVFAIHYTSATSSPEIRIIQERKIEKTDKSVTITDDGYVSLGSLTLQEFRFINKPLFACKDLAVRNNRLIAANITEREFDVVYDARAYRWNVGGTAFFIDDSSESDPATIDEFANCVTGAYGTYKYAKGTLVAGWAGDIGGEGTNVAYTFSTIDLPLDHKGTINQGFGAKHITQTWDSSLSGTGVSFVDNHSYSSYASPVNAGQVVGYKRGEIYRFGIVFRDSRGRVSPVKWIGDIQFPDFDEGIHTETIINKGTPKYWDLSADLLPLTIDGMNSDDYIVNNTYGNEGDYYHELTIVWTGTATTTPYTIDHADNFNYYSVLRYVDAFSKLFINKFNMEIEHKVTPGASPTLDIKVTDPDALISSMYIKAYKHDGTLIDTYNFAATAAVADTTTAGGPTNNTVTNKGDTTTSSPTAHVLYPIFHVANLPTDEWGETCSYEIVRVKREEKDQTRFAQGLVIGTVNASNNEYYPVTDIDKSQVEVERKVRNKSADGTGTYMDVDANGGTNPWTVNLISPDINFRKTQIRTGDYIKLLAYATGSSASYVADKGTHVYKVRGLTSIDTGTYTGTYSSSVHDAGIVEAQTDITELMPIHLIKDNKFRNVLKDGNNNLALAGTSAFIALNNRYVIHDDLLPYVFVGEVTRTLTNQYGGNTYEDRLNNEYISCGHFNTGTAEQNPVFGGDTYIAYFDYLRGMWTDADYNNKVGDYQQVILVPVETTINLDYRFDKSFHRVLNDWFGTARYLQEKAGDYSNRAGTVDEINYLQEYDLYLENPVYSKANDLNVYLPKAIYEVGLENDTMIRISEEYDYNNPLDDLIKFLPENYKIVDTTYGSIQKLVNLNDNLIFFQERAIGTQEIRERSLIQDSTGSALVLGTGDVAGHFAYHSVTSGTRHPRSVSVSPSGIYYFDGLNKSLNLFNGKTMEVSTVKGLNSYFDTYINDGIVSTDTPYLGYGVITAYDSANHRLLFTYLNDGDDIAANRRFTVSYNEIIEGFESFHSYEPNAYFTDVYGNIHSPHSSTAGIYHVHGKGTYGHYYGAYADSYVTFIVNDNPIYNKKFNNIEWESRVGTDSLISYTDTDRALTVNKIHFWTDYQNNVERTTVIYPSAVTTPATQIAVRRLMSGWRAAIPTLDVSGVPTRLFDRHLFTKMTFTNSANDDRFVLHYVKTGYQIAQY